jgi:hypothetical protein
VSLRKVLGSNEEFLLLQSESPGAAKSKHRSPSSLKAISPTEEEMIVRACRHGIRHKRQILGLGLSPFRYSLCGEKKEKCALEDLNLWPTDS